MAIRLWSKTDWSWCFVVSVSIQDLKSWSSEGMLTSAVAAPAAVAVIAIAVIVVSTGFGSLGCCSSAVLGDVHGVVS